MRPRLPGVVPLQILSILTALFAISPPAHAQQGWTSTPPALPLGSASVAAPEVVAEASGAGIAAWIECEGPACQIAAARFASDAWTPAVVVAPPGYLHSLRIAASPAGDAALVWIRGADATTGVVESARYSAATRTWSLPVPLSMPGDLSQFSPDVAISPAGDAIAVWETRFPFRVQAARYAAAAGTWGPPSDLADGVDVSGPRIAMDAAGDATAVWGELAELRASHYTATGGTWSSAEDVATSDGPVDGPQVGLDAAGNLLVVWADVGQMALHAITAVRRTKADATWSSPASVSAPEASSNPVLAVDAVGNATVAWGDQTGGIRTARYAVASGTWSAPAGVAGLTTGVTIARLGGDAAGNAFVTFYDPQGRVGAVRYSAGTGWLPPVTLSDPGPYNAPLAVDALGNATVVFGYLSTIYGTRWLATPAAPAITGVGVSSATLSVDFTAPATTEAAFAPTTYEYSTDDGVTWTPRSPASTLSPLVIGSLPDFVSYSVRLRAVNGAGAGAASAPFLATPGPPLWPPTGLVATSVADNTVTLAWASGAGGVAPTGYLLEGGISQGEVLASIPTGSDAPTFTFAAPTGTFYVRVVAVAGGVRSAPSNEIRIFVNVPAAPSAPTSLLEAVNGVDLLLSWTPTFGGGAPTGYVLNVSGALSAQLPLPLGERFAFSGVPSGTYTLSVSARNASGISTPSNPVTLTFPGSCIDGPLPGTPMRFRVTKTGSTLTVEWEPPIAGRAVSGYRLFVDGMVSGGGPWVFDIPTTSRTLAGEVPPGAYTLSVAGVNACFTGVSSPPVTVVVP